MSRRVFILGIDGGTNEVISRMIKQGELPNFKKITDNGSYGTLLSCIPSLTPVAWPTMLTGVDPGNHGIFDFAKRVEGTYSSRNLNSSNIKAKTLWMILSDAGKNVISVDVPMTYPPEKVNGIIVSGFGVPGVGSNFVYPKEMRKKILGMIPDYKLEPFMPDMASPDEKATDVFVKDAHEIIESRKKLCMYLMDEHPWDAFMVVFSSTDRLQHLLWRYYDERHPLYEKKHAKKYFEAIEEAYRKIDSFLGEIMERFEKDAENETLIVIPSDHGFGFVYKQFRLGPWLKDHGYADTDPKDNKNLLKNEEFRDSNGDGVPDEFGSEMRGSGRIGVSKEGLEIEIEKEKCHGGVRQIVKGLKKSKQYCLKLVAKGSEHSVLLRILEGPAYPILSRIPFNALIFQRFINSPNARLIGSATFGREFCERKFFFTPLSDNINLSLNMTTYGKYPTGKAIIKEMRLFEVSDWKKTKAYVIKGVMGIHVNLKGREPHGCVDLEDYETIVNKIREGLLSEKDEQSGQSIFKNVYKGHELYSGKYVDQGPDIVTVLNPIYNPESKYMEPVKNGWTGNHRREGIVMIHGPGVKKGKITAEIMDVAPTILRYLGLSSGMDGKEMDVFSNEIKVGSSEANSGETGERGEYNEEEDALVKERLQNLGYLD